MKRKKMVYLESTLLKEFEIYSILKDKNFSEMLSEAMREYLRVEKRNDRLWEKAKENLTRM